MEFSQSFAVTGGTAFVFIGEPEEDEGPPPEPGDGANQRSLLMGVGDD